MPFMRTPTPPPSYGSPALAGSGLKPYLELPHLLSLSWLAYPILSLLLIAFRLIISSNSAQDDVGRAKADMIAACAAAERAATGAASLPRYMALATNVRIENAVNDTLEGAREALVLALTIMEAIINFIVDIYRSTFLCFVECGTFIPVRYLLLTYCEGSSSVAALLSSSLRSRR
jgi:hypothetical protein